jgi:hypothetical protein
MKMTVLLAGAFVFDFVAGGFAALGWWWCFALTDAAALLLIAATMAAFGAEMQAKVDEIRFQAFVGRLP